MSQWDALVLLKSIKITCKTLHKACTRNEQSYTIPHLVNYLMQKIIKFG